LQYVDLVLARMYSQFVVLVFLLFVAACETSKKNAHVVRRASRYVSYRKRSAIEISANFTIYCQSQFLEVEAALWRRRTTAKRELRATGIHPRR
jgi:hypothetical protein